MKGVLNVLKPPGMTSHDVVNFIRRLTKVKKVGHTGTLDPGAAGVLAVCLGPATRIIRFLNDDKKYRVEITFGISTSTGDAEGEVIQTCDASALSCKSVGKILNDFKGDIEQTPPMASAVHYLSLIHI
jgi:tRNA pseudouridine55 synthase